VGQKVQVFFTFYIFRKLLVLYATEERLKRNFDTKKAIYPLFVKRVIAG